MPARTHTHSVRSFAHKRKGTKFKLKLLLNKKKFNIPEMKVKQLLLKPYNLT